MDQRTHNETEQPYCGIEDYAKDGRLAGPAGRKRYRTRDMIKEVKRLGRPLTAREARKYRVYGKRRK